MSTFGNAKTHFFLDIFVRNPNAFYAVFIHLFDSIDAVEFHLTQLVHTACFKNGNIWQPTKYVVDTAYLVTMGEMW
jgi:hypothetical protein